MGHEEGSEQRREADLERQADGQRDFLEDTIESRPRKTFEEPLPGEIEKLLEAAMEKLEEWLLKEIPARVALLVANRLQLLFHEDD